MFKDALFYILWAILAFLPLSVTIINSQKIRNKIINSLLVLIITFITAILLFREPIDEKDRWNNGICECGGTYELTAVTHYRTYHEFYYTCNTCGHTEEFSHLMK